MRLVTYIREGDTRTGALIGNHVVDLNRAYRALLQHHQNIDELVMADVRLPTDMIRLLQAGEPAIAATRQIDAFFGLRLENESDQLQQAGIAFPLTQVSLKAPVLRPGKVVCLGLNYRPHADETGFEYPEFPVLFHKTSTSIIGNGQAVLIPPGAEQVDFEAELALIIGKRGKRIAEENAYAHIAAYTCANDVSERGWQFRTLQWTTGKMLDAFCPLGPALVTRDEIPEPGNLNIQLTLNGRVMQSANTREMIFNIPQIVSYISQICTLEPGDVILTGTPSGVGHSRTPPVYLQAGDTVSVEIEQVGLLTNPVQKEIA